MPSNHLTVPFTMAATFMPSEVSQSSDGRYRVISRGSTNSTRGSISVDSSRIHINTDMSAGFSTAPIDVGEKADVVVRFMSDSTAALVKGVEHSYTGTTSMDANSIPLAIGSQTGAPAGRHFSGAIGAV